MPSTLDAITAAGITYKASDYANPNLDRPTALTVTADGRVFGHLAKWGTCHIGHTGQCVTPPSSAQGYKYFHQGVVATEDGDLPVGKLTLGTGHAALGENAVAAAAHYDNTGSTVATVRAGEDQHGIWLAGRLVPGASPERIDELRRSGVSGDWRGIDGAYELVAALAVNTPGFPVPRTEELVASGGVQTLVAAGVVAPPTADDLQAMVAAAVDERVAAELSARDRLARARAQMAALTASAAADRRQALADDMARVQAARAAERMDLTAAAPGDVPEQLRAYWTRGAGLARWAKSAHPYTALVRSLRREITGRPDSMIKGLAANLFRDVFGIWPGQRESLTAAAESESGDHSSDGMVALLPTTQDAERLSVPDGEPADEMHLTLGYFPDVTAMPDDEAILSTLSDVLPGPIDGTIGGHATFNPDTEGKTPCAVYLVQADGLSAANEAIAPEGDYDSFTPHITAKYDPTEPLTASGPVAFDRIRISRAGEHTDVPLEGITAGGRRVRSQQGAERYNVSVGDLIPKAMLQAQQTAGDFAEAAGNDVAKLIDPSRGKKKPEPKKTEGKEPSGGDGKRMEAHTEPVATTGKNPAPKPAEKPKAAPKAKAAEAAPKNEPVKKADPVVPETPKAPSNQGAKPEPPQVKAAPKAKPKTPTAEPPKKQDHPADNGGGGKSDSATPKEKPTPLASPNGDGVARPVGYPPATSSYDKQPVGSPIDTVAPARLSGSGGDMHEDEIPAKGADGGALVEFRDGQAIYDDGSITDGTEWTAAAPSMIENAAAARAADMQKAAADDPSVIKTDVPPRTAGYGAYMEEDQSPEFGANGGQLTDYSDGVATYDDGTSTNGVLWRQAEPAAVPPPQPDALAASAHRRALRRIGLSSYPAAWKVA